MRQNITIINKLGLHARAAAKLVQCASGFDAEVVLHKDGRQVNAKSIMGVMMLAAGMGTELEIETGGPDESAAMEAVVELIEDRFGEPE